MSRREESLCFGARLKVREVAMGLARAGLSDDVIREALKDIAETEAERAIAWGHEEDERMAARDREDVADEMDARRAHDLAEQESA